MDIRKRFLEEAPRGSAGRLAIAAVLTLAGLWIGLFSWLGSYAYDLAERWSVEETAKPPRLLPGK